MLNLAFIYLFIYLFNNFANITTILLNNNIIGGVSATASANYCGPESQILKNYKSVTVIDN